MHYGLHALAGEVLLQLVAAIALRDEIDEGMELVRFLLWQPDGHALEQRAIELGIGAPPLDHGVELAQPEPKHRRLQGIEARDGAKLTDRVAIDETVIAQQ